MSSPTQWKKLVKASTLTILTVALLFSVAATGNGQDPVAKLTITQSDGFYTLDASQSVDHDGNIVEYKFDKDNDGHYDLSTSSATYSTSFNTVPSEAKVKVKDDHGNTDTAVASYSEASKKCDITSGYMYFTERKIKEGQTSEAYVYIYNDGDQQTARVTFYKDGRQIEQLTKDVSGRERFSATISPEETSEISMVSDTVGNPCGDQQIGNDKETIYVDSAEQEGVLDLRVIDEDGDEVEDARVKVGNNVKYTDNNGRITFSIEPKYYNGEVSKNYYFTEEFSVDIESGETRSKTVEMLSKDAEGHLNVRTVDEDGDELENVDVHVRNSESYSDETDNDGEVGFDLEPDEYRVTVSKSGYRTTTRTVDIGPGENRDITIEMRESSNDEENAFIDVNVEDDDGDALEDATVRVENGDVEVEETDRFGNAQFEVEPDRYDIRVSKSGYDTETRTITVDEGDFRTVNFQLDDDNNNNGDEARLDVTVLDEDNDELEDARVRVENGDTETEFTDNDGEARFFLEPDRYDVEVSRSGYDTETRRVTLSDGERESITVRLDRDFDDDEDARLEVMVEDEDGDELEDARVEVENGDREVEFTDDDGEALFFLEADRYDIEVSKSGYEDETDSIRLDEGDDERITIELEDDRDEDDARLDVEVEDEDGDELDDVRVEVENGDRDVDFTDDGEVRFYLEPDRYDVEVSKSGYRTETESIRLREDDRETLRFTLERGSDVSIVSTRLSETTICRGDTVFVYANIRNDDNSDQRVTFGARGLGSTVANSVTIDGDSTEEKRLRINNAQGSGTEQIEIAVTNGDTDEVTTTVTVENCNGQPPVPGTTASAVSINVQPQDIEAGQSVQVSGYVDGTRGSQSVEISIGGNTVANVATEPDGFYQAYVTPQNVGVQEIRAESGDRSATAQIKVRPNVYVAAVDTEERVFESEEFEICADVQSQVEPSVVLFRNGDRIASQTGKGEVCFETEAQEPDEYTYRVMASAWAVTDSKSREVEVLEEDDEVKNFPDRMAMVRSGDGIARVTIYNTGDDLRTYDVSVNGIPEDWFATTEKQVELSKGEKRNVYFYVTPEAEGNFAATINVDRDGSNVFEETISISSGGTTDSGRKSWIERIASLFRNY